MDQATLVLVEQDRHERVLDDIRERGISARASFAHEARLGTGGGIFLAAIMSAAAIVFARINPDGRVLSVLMVAASAALAGGLLIWLRAWFRRALAEEAVTFEGIDGYLTGFPAKQPCPSCGQAIDWWATVVAALEQNFFFVKAVELVGARSTVLVRTLRRDSALELDLESAGIPANALILAIGSTSDGALFPAEVRQHYFTHERISHKLRLFPMSLGNPTPPEQVELTIMVTWYESSGNLESDYLFDALYAFAVETRTDQLSPASPRWERVIVPAHQSLELIIGRFIADALKGRFVADALKRERLRAQRFNYAVELKRLLPLVAQAMSGPPLPRHILDGADKLRAIRNRMIHEGSPKTPLTRAQAATLLAAAIFTFEYVLLLRRVAKL